MTASSFAEIHRHLTSKTRLLLQEAGREDAIGRSMGDMPEKYLFTRQVGTETIPILAINHSLARLEVYPDGQNIKGGVFCKLRNIFIKRGYSVSPVKTD